MRIAVLFAVIVSLSNTASGQFDIPHVPDSLWPSSKDFFTKANKALKAELKHLQELTREFNNGCAGKKITNDQLINQCRALSAEIDGKEARLIKDIAAYKTELAKDEEQAKRDNGLKSSIMDNLKNLKWSQEKIDWLTSIFKEEENEVSLQKHSLWKEILKTGGAVTDSLKKYAQYLKEKNQPRRTQITLAVRG